MAFGLPPAQFLATILLVGTHVEQCLDGELHARERVHVVGDDPGPGFDDAALGQGLAKHMPTKDARQGDAEVDASEVIGLIGAVRDDPDHFRASGFLCRLFGLFFGATSRTIGPFLRLIRGTLIHAVSLTAGAQRSSANDEAAPRFTTPAHIARERGGEALRGTNRPAAAGQWHRRPVGL